MKLKIVYLLLSLLPLLVPSCTIKSRTDIPDQAGQEQDISELGEIQAAYDRILDLKGEWEGSFEWTGAITGIGYLKAIYSINGSNSAMIENLVDEKGNITMTTIYHLDGPSSLRATHFCMYNQPRFRATEVGTRAIKFDIIDITNLPEKNPGHVYGLALDFLSQDSLHITFDYRKGNILSKELVHLGRVR